MGVTCIQDYETRHMVPTEYSHKLAERAIELMCTRLPNIGMRSVVKNLAIALLDDRLREAMMFVYRPTLHKRCLLIILVRDSQATQASRGVQDSDSHHIQRKSLDCEVHAPTSVSSTWCC